MQVLSALAPLALLPVLARAAGVSGWASLAAGQSVGALVSAFALYGWAIQGPALVAPATESERWHVYRSSMVSRCFLLAVTLPVGCVVSLAIAAEGYVPLTLLMTGAQAATALSPTWFAIGVGRPRMILRFDTMPRLLGVLASAIAIAVGAPLVTYPLVLIVTTLGGVAAFSVVLSRTSKTRPSAKRSIGRELRLVLRGQASAAAAQIAGASYGSATVAVVGLFATTVATAEFAAGDRFYRFTLMAVVAAGNTFQGWVAEIPYPESRSRMKTAVGGLTALGVVGALAIGSLAPWATALLFGRDLSVGRGTSVWFALAFFGICVSSSLGRNVLIPLGRASQLLMATIAGAVVGLPCMALLARSHGAAGGAAGYAISELIGALVLAGMLLARPPAADRRNRDGSKVAPEGACENAGSGR